MFVLLAVTTAASSGSLGSAGAPSPQASLLKRPSPGSPRCSDARKAIVYYHGRWHHYLSALKALKAHQRHAKPRTCNWTRFLAKRWQKRAQVAQKAYQRWHFHWAWWDWLPAKHQRVAACETGHQGGTGPGGSRWDWDSGTYVSAFGIYRPAYNDDAARAGNLGWDETKRKLGRLPTPREQMQAVDSHRAAHGGWSGWGCRGA